MYKKKYYLFLYICANSPRLRIFVVMYFFNRFENIVIKIRMEIKYYNYYWKILFEIIIPKIILISYLFHFKRISNM